MREQWWPVLAVIVVGGFIYPVTEPNLPGCSTAELNHQRWDRNDPTSNATEKTTSVTELERKKKLAFRAHV